MQHIFRQNYSVTTKKNDIALVKFFGSIEFNDFIRPACIRLATDEVPVTENLVIAGWGSIEAESQSLLFFLSLVVNFSKNLCFAGTNRSEALLKAYVNTVPLEECNQTLIQNNLADLPSLRGLSRSQMCASNLAEGSDACQGDSGGPIFQHHQHSGFSVLIGIVSFGVSCGTELPGVYTRIAFYADWIESIVWP